MLPFLGLIANRNSLANALVTVPDPPVFATLDVVGADALEVSFEQPPLSDGGSPITSYMVRNSGFQYERFSSH